MSVNKQINKYILSLILKKNREGIKEKRRINIDWLKRNKCITLGPRACSQGWKALFLFLLRHSKFVDASKSWYCFVGVFQGLLSSSFCAISLLSSFLMFLWQRSKKWDYLNAAQPDSSSKSPASFPGNWYTMSVHTTSAETLLLR